MSAVEQDTRWVEWVESASAVTILPGDVIVVKVSRRLSREQAEVISSQVKSAIPGDHRVLVLPPEMDLGILRPEDD